MFNFGDILYDEDNDVEDSDQLPFMFVAARNPCDHTDTITGVPHGSCYLLVAVRGEDVPGDPTGPGDLDHYEDEGWVKA